MAAAREVAWRGSAESQLLAALPQDERQAAYDALHRRSPNHYRRLIQELDTRRASSRAQVKLALAEGAQVVEHALLRIGRHRAEAANG